MKRNREKDRNWNSDKNMDRIFNKKMNLYKNKQRKREKEQNKSSMNSNTNTNKTRNKRLKRRSPGNKDTKITLSRNLSTTRNSLVPTMLPLNPAIQEQLYESTPSVQGPPF